MRNSNESGTRVPERIGRAALLPTLLIVAVVGSAATGCLPSSIRWDKSALAPALQRPAELRISVVPDPEAAFAVSEYELERFAADLRATGIFASVDVGAPGEADLLAVTRFVDSGPACGNPLIPTMFTFGLLPTTLPRWTSYDFHFASPSGEATVPLRLSYSTDERFGLVAVPMRLSRKWSRSPDDGTTPKPFIAALRADLVSRYNQLMDLAAVGSTRDLAAR